MNKFALILTLLLVSLSALSCADKKSNRTTATTPTVIDFENLSVAEVLATKYLKAELACTLWHQFGKELNLSLPPNSTFTFNLIAGNLDPDNLKLTALVAGRSIDVFLSINDIDIEDVELTTLDGHLYKMIYSPVIQLKHNSLRYEHEDGSAKQSGQSFGTNTLFEKNNTTILSDAVTYPNHSGTYFNQVDCTFTTELKPDYQNHFIIIK